MLDVKYSVEVPDFYCMLAKALDYDELDQFREWLSAGNKANKFPWSSSDRAGTRPFMRGGNPSQAMARTIMSLARGEHLPDGFQRRVTGAGREAVERLAKAQGRQVAYVCPDGTTRDSSGVPIERTREMIPYSFRQEGEFEAWLSDRYIQQQ